MEDFVVIHSYTRADMIADGELVDVTNLAKEAGFKVPVAVSRTVYEGYVVPSTEDAKRGQDETGRLWDTLNMARFAFQFNKNSLRVQYPVSYVMNGEDEPKILKAIRHPGDSGEQVITIMLPSED